MVEVGKMIDAPCAAALLTVPLTQTIGYLLF